MILLVSFIQRYFFIACRHIWVWKSVDVFCSTFSRFSLADYIILGTIRLGQKWYASFNCLACDASRFSVTKSVFIYCRVACVMINAIVFFVLLPCTPRGNGPSIILWCFITIGINYLLVLKFLPNISLPTHIITLSYRLFCCQTSATFPAWLDSLWERKHLQIKILIKAR